MNLRQYEFVVFFSKTALLLLCFTPWLAPVSFSQSAPQSPRDATASDVREAAQRGDSGAQYRFAKAILDHNPGPDDVQFALKLLHNSVAQGNSNAEFYLGYLYEHGEFVAQDYPLAFQNYQAAAQVHHPPAESNLGSLYLHGQGVPKNLAKAFEWYLASAQHGDSVGQINLANLYCGGSGSPRNYNEAVRWLRAAADSGLPEAQNSLAYFYFYGLAVQRDYTEAARLVRLAVQQGLPGAETSLGYLYEQGKGVPLDYVSAYTWYSQAMGAGNQAAADRRKQLAQLMSRKQLDEANSAVASQSKEQSSLRTTPFSLVDH
jgi:TPR repeat protein